MTAGCQRERSQKRQRSPFGYIHGRFSPELLRCHHGFGSLKSWLANGEFLGAWMTISEVAKPIVLVVEDEYWVRLAVAEELRLVGFDVLEARDADDAVRAMEAQHVDAVFSDLTMPGSMDGIGLINWILEHRPGLKMIVTSGKSYSPTELPSAIPFIGKPYAYAEVAARLRTALGEQAKSSGIHVEIDHTAKLVVATALGVVTLEDMLAYFHVLARSGAMSYRKLFDARQLDSQLNEDDMKVLGARVRANAAFDPRGPIAAVATTAESVGAVQRFKDLGGAVRPVEIFDTIEGAKAWLALR